MRATTLAIAACALLGLAAGQGVPVPKALAGKWSGNAAVAYGSPGHLGQPFVCLPEDGDEVRGRARVPLRRCVCPRVSLTR